MNTWRRRLVELFPEFSDAPEDWDAIAMSSALGALLERAARSGDRDTGKRALAFVLWLDGESKNNEMFVYQCQDILRGVISSAPLRSYFFSLLNRRSFAQLAGYIEYLSSKKILAEMEQAIRLNRHGPGPQD